MNRGSVDSLTLSARHGRSPNACQMRVTAVWFSPTALASERVDQWVAFLGLCSKVLTINAPNLSSLILRGAPGRGSARSPFTPLATKRRRHLPTVA